MSFSSFVECEPIGRGIYDSNSQKTFYSNIIVNGISITLKDYVRTRLEIDEDDTNELKGVGYGQILAIFDDSDEENGIKVEIRWFLEPSEIRLVKKRRPITYKNELFESTIVQDIPAGSIIDHISIVNETEINENNDTNVNLNEMPFKKIKKRHNILDLNESNNYKFICRYFFIDSENTLIQIDPADIWKRAQRYSEYSQIYSTSSSSLDNSNEDNNSNNDRITNNSSTIDRYTNAITRLHVSFIPADLPCRQEEFQTIINYLKNSLNHFSTQTSSSSITTTTSTLNHYHSGPLYISGMPGTGKTATVLAAINKLKKDINLGLISDFEFILINGLRLSSPQDAYSLLWKSLSGDYVTPKTALNQLKNYFLNKKVNDNIQLICLLDELDYLVTVNETVVYNFLEWSQQPHSKFIIIGIANTMDLPERLSKRSLSRMGGRHLNRLPFRAYSYDQIFLILSNRLKNLNEIFDQKTLEFAARKAAAYAGDLRSALKICQRAIELHKESQQELNSNSLISIQSVTRAALEYRQNPLMIAIKQSSNIDKAIFLAIGKRYQVTGISGMLPEEIWRYTQQSVNNFEGLESPSWNVFQEVFNRLIGQGLIVPFEPSGTSSFRLKVSEHRLYTTKLNQNDILATLQDEKDSN